MQGSLKNSSSNDLQESKDQTILRYLGGLDFRYTHVVELQQYTAFDDICVLAHKVEQQNKSNSLKGELPKPPPKGQAFNKGNSFQPYKPMTPIAFTPQKSQTP